MLSYYYYTLYYSRTQNFIHPKLNWLTCATLVKIDPNRQCRLKVEYKNAQHSLFYSTWHIASAECNSADTVILFRRQNQTKQSPIWLLMNLFLSWPRRWEKITRKPPLVALHQSPNLHTNGRPWSRFHKWCRILRNLFPSC